MKIFNITFCNGLRNISVTVSTLKDIEFPAGSIHRWETFSDPMAREFLANAFEYEYSKRIKEGEEVVFNSFSEVDFMNVFEIKYPLI